MDMLVLYAIQYNVTVAQTVYTILNLVDNFL